MDISVLRLREIMKNNEINLIDIRNSDAYRNGTINNAINVPFNELLYNTNKYLNKTDNYYIFCSNGNNSRKIVNLLNTLGYKTYNIVGGYNEYILEK